MSQGHGEEDLGLRGFDGQFDSKTKCGIEGFLKAGIQLKKKAMDISGDTYSIVSPKPSHCEARKTATVSWWMIGSPGGS